MDDNKMSVNLNSAILHDAVYSVLRKGELFCVPTNITQSVVTEMEKAIGSLVKEAVQ
jgi:hypothetical protein